jgi:DNA-binding NtrC family response regulator
MRVLLIGDLAGGLATAARIAMARGARLLQSTHVADALRQLRADAAIDLVLCEVDQDIAGLIATLGTERIAAPVIACGPEDDIDAAAGAMRAGAREYLPLPPDPDLIAAILQAVVRESEDVIAFDPAMRAVLSRAEQIARSDASVLIGGESGTGKEVLARYIHRHSRRAHGPFVALNCAALPEQLLESELFGHEKGAFSGAQARRIGRFEAANGGTLLLDEISEMDIRLQAKLLRALQEREIDRLGGSAPVRIDVRILATTNRDLPAEVAAGRFREDLFFRLNVVTLRLPALRDRPADIAPLADHFAHQFAALNALPDRPLSEEARARLARHHWRGNVRELENTMHRAVLLATGPRIDATAIELDGEANSTAPAPPASTVPSPVTPAMTPPDSGIASLVGRRMEDVERDLILHTLGHTLGNRTHAALILGISIRALRNKLRDYAAQGIAVPPPGAGIAA